MAVIAQRRQESFEGLRPLDPMRDLRGVADLIEVAFASDLDRAGQSALQELRWLSRLKPVLWWMIYTNPKHTDFLSGFVWEEEGKIVGNITINRTGLGSTRWLISNVAVAKAYRGRGIARGLMYAGLELVKEYRGSSASLQVRTDNTPARQLYESLQFQAIAGTTYLWARRPPAVDELPLPRRVVLRPRNYTITDAREAYNLACAATPLTAQREWPLRQRTFHLNGGERFNNMLRQIFGLGPTVHWVMEDGQRFIAMLNILPGGWGQPHQIELTVHPDWRGILEEVLISKAFAHLRRWRGQEVSIKHPAYHTEAIDIYKSLGLKETQTLVWMKLNL